MKYHTYYDEGFKCYRRDMNSGKETWNIMLHFKVNNPLCNGEYILLRDNGQDKYYVFVLATRISDEWYGYKIENKETAIALWQKQNLYTQFFGILKYFINIEEV